MEICLRRRRTLKGRLTRIESFLGAQGEAPLDPRLVEKYQEQLEVLWKELNEIQDEVGELCEDLEFEAHQGEFNQLAARIEALQIQLPDLRDLVRDGDARPPTAAPANSGTTVRLPRLELPIFSGSLHQWTSFFDLFTATIHANEQLTGAQKLQYLKSSLRGEAATLLQSIQVTDDNFTEAWDILTQRYDNKREIINAHLKRLCTQQTLVSEAPAALRKLIDTTNEAVRALRVLKAPVEHWDMILVYLVCEKLDPDSRRQWELTLKTTETSKYVDLIAFLELRARALLTCAAPRPTQSGAQPPKERRLPIKASHHAGTAKDTCPICRDRHSAFNCPEMLQASIEERRRLARTHNLCYNCLSGDHAWKRCKASGCRKCGKKHHTLVHLPEAAQEQGTVSEEDNQVTTHHGTLLKGDSPPSLVLLATALVRVQDAQGSHQICRALLDSGSQASFITEACAQRLGLPRQRVSVVVSGISESNVSVAKGSINISLNSCVYPSDVIKVNALVLKKVTATMPSSPFDPRKWNHVPRINLADPDFHRPSTVDVLLGADVVADVIKQGLRRGPKGMPIAQNSSLGWLVSGRINAGPTEVRVSANTAQTELVTAVQKFWELEEVPNCKQLSEEEARCEAHFVSTYNRDSEGRFIVRLPLKVKQVVMDSRESRTAAIQRLTQVERRISRDPKQEEEYREFLLEYQQLGHMKPLTASEAANKSSIYLPHHAVIKEGSTSTRLRVVFDASAKGRHSSSLNDHLMVGPTLQDDIFSILIRFRTHAIAITADVKKMYRQIRVHDADTRYQNIVWRPSPEMPIQDYCLLTLTYGTASAPFLATRCLQQLAKDDGEDLPGAAEATLRDFYVDDVMTGAETVEGAIDLREQLTTLLSRGGFELRKWTSSSREVLDTIPPQLRELTSDLTIDSDEKIKTLGLQWSPTSDAFSFRIEPTSPTPIYSKRSLLSVLARIYDPLGLLSPVTVKGKILLQNLWRTPCTWDEDLPVHIKAEWIQYCHELSNIEAIKIPRRLTEDGATEVELHGFCDASESAYAAVVFLKSKYPDGTFKVTLIAAKTRVAPIKTISIPRLELCSALLLANLVDAVQRAFKAPVPVINAWTDSTVVLAWINASSSRWKTFVANRVTKIQAAIPADKWYHVPGCENPADCASRGISAGEIKDHPLWWAGPDWLRRDSTVASTPQLTGVNDLVIQEERNAFICTAVIPEPMFEKFSSLSTLRRVTAFVFRFVRNCRLAVEERMNGHLTRGEIDHALFHWIKEAQKEVFPLELKCLVTHQPIPKGSCLVTLNPFIDAQGLIRVGGRLQNAVMSTDQKFPILLPKKHALTTLIIRYEHQRTLHGGPQLLLSSLQQHYWILGGRNVVRQHVQQCVTCCRQRATVPRPMMGDLPAARVNQARAFLRSGVDYAGPFQLRALKLRGQKTYKAYVALFVCFTTHAIHLEIVSDLTTDAFIAALKRFVARRGHCSELYSDQGTNFVGANRELKVLRQLIKTPKHNETVAQFLGESGTNWYFNPPAAPHFGGLWEAGVKSIKHHLRRVVGNVSLNFEEMDTVLSQIEACLNSRPLCPISSSPDDLQALTPGHFLIGGPLITVAEPDYASERMTRLSRWQLVQRLYQHFWNRWSREYLSRLQQRPKAWTTNSGVKINDLVLIKDENQPPSRWRLGRIARVHPGSDGVVRVVTVKTQAGELRRPVVKICRLPSDSS